MNAATSSQMLLAFWRQRDRDAPWGRRGLLALLLLALGASLYAAPLLWELALACSAALALAALWLAVASSLMQQNHPHAARFVPGHVRRLRTAALAVWGLAALGSAGLLALGLPRLPSFAALLLGLAGGLALLAWSLRNWPLWLLLSFGPGLYFGLGLERLLAPLWQGLHALWQAQPTTMLALGLLALGWSITRLFGDGDAAHRASYARRERMRRATQDGFAGKSNGAAALGRPGAWLARPLEHASAAWLQHAIARVDASRRSIMRRAEIVLHGPQHWLRLGLSTLLALAIVALILGIAFAVYGANLQGNWTRGVYGMAIGLASAGLNPSFVLPNMLWHSRREQALLRLLPGLPQGAALNRAVAWLQLRQTLAAWALTSAALGLLAWAAGDPALLCLAFAALPLLAACQLRVPARMGPPSGWTATLPALGALLGGWGLYALNHWLEVPLAALAGACLAAALLIGLWRWRALVRAPMALPAGRLG